MDLAALQGEGSQPSLGCQQVQVQALGVQAGQHHPVLPAAAFSQVEVPKGQGSVLELEHILAAPETDLIVGLEIHLPVAEVEGHGVPIEGRVLGQGQVAEMEGADGTHGIHPQVPLPAEGLAAFRAAFEGVGVPAIPLELETIQRQGDRPQRGRERLGRGLVQEFETGPGQAQAADPDFGRRGLRFRRLRCSGLHEVQEVGLSVPVQDHPDLQPIQLDDLEARRKGEQRSGADVHIEPVPAQEGRTVLLPHGKAIQGQGEGEGVQARPGQAHRAVQFGRQQDGQLPAHQIGHGQKARGRVQRQQDPGNPHPAALQEGQDPIGDGHGGP